MRGSRAGMVFALWLMACVPLHDLDSASRGGGGAAGQAQATCRDGLVNGAESDVDCGGNACEKCSLGDVCRQDSDCTLGSCVDRHCQAAHCIDQKMSVGETDVDCGGEQCSPCGVHQVCQVALDCRSNACASYICVATGCDNGSIDGSETDLNCGGGTCSACRLGRHCELGGDCESGVCLEGSCSTPECGNQIQDASEQGVDCGGTCPKACAANCSGAPVASTGGTAGCGAGGRSFQAGGASSGGRAQGGTSSVAMGGALAGGPSAGGASTGGASAGGALAGGASGASAGGGALARGGAGAGGAPGSGGSAQGGVGGSVASGGSSAGASGSAGTSGTLDPTCAGCARLSVPLASATDKANFVITLPSQKDFSSAIVTMRVYVKAGTGGQLRAYIQHGGSPDYLQLFQNVPAEVGSLSGWQDIVWNVGAHETTYDKTIVGRIGIQISGAGATSFTNPTVVYVDSLSVTGVDTGPWTFDSSATIYAVSAVSAAANVMFCNFGDSPIAGSKVIWYSH